MPTTRFDLPRALLQILAIGILIVSTLWVVRPFLVAVTWATTIVVATWPLLVGLESLLGGGRRLAVAIMTCALLLVLVIPLSYGIELLVRNSHQIVELSKSIATLRVPAPPSWIEGIPLVGGEVFSRWQQLAALATDDLAAMFAPYAQGAALWVAHQVGGVGRLVFSFLLTVLVAAILYANGESAALFVRKFARRLTGEQGENAVQLAASAIRGVALGVVVTATLQTLLVGIGLAAAGIPFATILVALTFVLCIAQVGPLPVLIPATIWVYANGGTAWGAAFLVWALICGLMDNFVRPALIRRGADLPLLLIFSGVIGGLLAMGVIGLFLGPVILAVAYTVLTEWVAQSDDSVADGHTDN